MDPIDRELASIGLRAGGPCGFALAGGHAVAAHGILSRPSEDVDLFADWQRRADFPAAVDQVVAAYEAAGYRIEVDHRVDTFARLYATPPRSHVRRRVDLVANWRAHAPVQMDIGPVLHQDDVMAGKVDALYNRAAPRDFLDVSAALAAGLYTGDQLCELAECADAGFDRAIFADALAVIDRYPDERFTAYSASEEQIASMRERIAAWRADLAEG